MNAAAVTAPPRDRAGRTAPVRPIPDGCGDPPKSDFPPTGRVAEAVVLQTRGGPTAIPGVTAAFDAFRPWVLSDDCPDDVQFSFLGDTLEIDPMSEAISSHGEPKSRMAVVVCGRVHADDLGYCGIDKSRLTNEEVGLSCEPDLLVVLWETVEAGRAWTTPKANRPDDQSEWAGTADLVGELLSDSSTGKDIHMEPPLLFAAGVREYWRADCRGDACTFELFTRGTDGWIPVKADRDGYRRSDVLGRSYRLDRLPPRAGIARFALRERE